MTSWRGRAVVCGEAMGMGSKRIGRAASGRPIILDQRDARLRSWQAELRLSMRASAPPALLTGAVAVDVRIHVLRPASHYGTGRNAGVLKASAPSRPATGRDIDKVVRAVLDCGTGEWWRDDRQVCVLGVSRWYCEREPRVEVEAWEPVGVGLWLCEVMEPIVHPGIWLPEE